MDLVHSHAGSDDERLQDPKLIGNLTAATQIANELAKSDPLSGYSQVIQAELISIWQLDDHGTPIEAQQEAVKLAEDALRIDPKLAQAHVAKSRTYAKAGRFPEASEEIEQALRLDPQLDSAMFVQAYIYRMSSNTAKAIEWIRMFIEATPQPAQKANGHEWLGRMYRDIAYHPDAHNREMYLLLARTWFQSSIDLDGRDPWRLAGFAAFLNENVADFAAAESYATKALAIEDIDPARLQLAAARYQSLQAKAVEMDVPSLQAAIADIQSSTRLSLDELVQSGVFREVVRLRLVRLQRKVPASAK
jgi:tetratricopeptide (TPR) repeat protein